MGISTVLLIVAVILFVLAAIPAVSSKVSIGWIGLAFFAASFLF